AGVRWLLLRKFSKELAFVRRYHKIPAEFDRAALYFGGREAVEKALGLRPDLASARAAERAAERDARERDNAGANRNDTRTAEREKDSAKGHNDVSGPRSDSTGSKDTIALSEPSGGDSTVIGAKSGDESKDNEGALKDGERAGDQTDGGDDGSNSGSNSGSQEDLSDDNSGSNSGSGSSGDSDDDDDEDDEDDNKRDQHAVVVPIENDDGGNAFREGELVVMSGDSDFLSRAEALGFSVIEARPLESIGAVVARLRRPEGVSSNEALALLRTREPGSPSGYNYIYRAAGHAPAPEDEQPDPQPAPTKTAKAGVRIGVIDGFSADNVAGWNVERLIDKPAKTGHGDAVAKILLRDLEAGYRVSPGKMLLLDVMREHPGGGAADVAALVLAFDVLVTARVGVANLSLAGPDHPALRMAVTKSVQSGLVVVAAVGNGGPAAPPAFPAAYDGVVGVAAVDATGKPYIYSGRGPHVDIAALGVDIGADGAGGELIGTSYAAPHVSALLASIPRAVKPGAIDKLLVAYAEDAGAPGRDPVYGVGILTPDKPERVALAAGGKASN
ncbi:MAG: S8 family serine peptidase, partial [Hyphomonadaceae bacterium]